jgi:hypothetical protein
VCTGSGFQTIRAQIALYKCDFYFYFAQELAWNLGGTVAKCEHREYGFARVQIKKFGSDPSRLSADALFEGLGDEMEVRVRGV